MARIGFNGNGAFLIRRVTYYLVPREIFNVALRRRTGMRYGNSLECPGSPRDRRSSETKPPEKAALLERNGVKTATRGRYHHARQRCICSTNVRFSKITFIHQQVRSLELRCVRSPSFDRVASNQLRPTASDMDSYRTRASRYMRFETLVRSCPTRGGLRPTSS